MLPYSELYPVDNEVRKAKLLDGLWKFQFDPEARGMEEGWHERGLPEGISMPVPSSFNDLFITRKERDFCGDFWYETSFFCTKEAADDRVLLRFGSITHRCSVFCNGVLVAKHEGGFLPVVADITEVVSRTQRNLLVVQVNNELNETSIPCGMTVIQKEKEKLALPYFDFFNYAGIHRSVWLVQTPCEAIQDFQVSYRLKDQEAWVDYEVFTNGQRDVRVQLKDQKGEIVAEQEGKKGTLYVSHPVLWKVRDAYLYTLVISIVDGDALVDRYSSRIGIRTVEIKGTDILLNGEPVYLKGFGRHEDFDLLGRGFHYAIAKRDFECMKWIEANCFRTSHYPYAEEWYQMADEEGFLIIDEVPAVGMMRSLVNYVEAGQGRSSKDFFSGCPDIELLRHNHKMAIEEMITRDKHHPSVIAWSLFNEAETTTDIAEEYFRSLFDFARDLDPQGRPLTGVLEGSSSPSACKCCSLMDFVCLNRYYGWYIHGGSQLETALQEFTEEMEGWKEKQMERPFVFTEFGADTLDSLHKLPSVMWSQEYQKEYLEGYFQIFDRYDFVKGELIWNYADFQTAQGIMRVNGNKKGIFTRDRQPKDAAYLVKKRWEDK
ncbi:MAG: beta-glucuronidase [Eubacteriales bacterium]|nr:beta-glucuronidase [Eubacteriales bacterium]